MKKLISVILLIYVCSSLVFAASFSDIENLDKPHINAIEDLTNKNIISGYPDGTFRPSNTITRAEFTKILVVAFDMKNLLNVESFSDINDHWAKEYIDTVYNNGIIKGYEGNVFKPDNTITYAETATILAKTLSLNISELKEGEDWYTPYWNAILEASLLNGIYSKDIIPSLSANRAVVALMVYNSLKYNELPRKKTVQVPNLVGDNSVSANMKLEQVGLKANFEEPVQHEFPEGYIIKQNIPVDEYVYEGTIINLTPSAGPRKVEVPNVIGSSLTAAVMKIRQANLEIELIEETNDIVPEDRIIRQDPPPNSLVDEKSAIKVFISTGPSQDDVKVNGSSQSIINDNSETKIQTINCGITNINGEFTVRLELKGDIKGRTLIYEGLHSRKDGIIEIPYPADATGILSIYINDELNSEKVLK